MAALCNYQICARDRTDQSSRPQVPETSRRRTEFSTKLLSLQTPAPVAATTTTTRSIFLLETEVLYLGAEWAGDPNGALTSIDTLDGSLHDICVDVHSLATTGVLSSSMLNARAPGLRIRVCNTRWSNHSGTHWFTIVYHQRRFSTLSTAIMEGWTCTMAGRLL